MEKVSDMTSQFWDDNPWFRDGIMTGEMKMLEHDQGECCLRYGCCYRGCGCCFKPRRRLNGESGSITKRTLIHCTPGRGCCIRWKIERGFCGPYGKSLSLSEGGDISIGTVDGEQTPKSADMGITTEEEWEGMSGKS